MKIKKISIQLVYFKLILLLLKLKHLKFTGAFNAMLVFTFSHYEYRTIHVKINQIAIELHSLKKTRKKCHIFNDYQLGVNSFKAIY